MKNYTEEFYKMLTEGCQEINLEIKENEVLLFHSFMELLLEWNQKMNLTAITEEKEVIVKHFLDSLLLYSKIEVPVSSRVIDIGTGAGFPGIPLKIVRPEIYFLLVDSLMKRVNFLKEVKEKLQLRDLSILHGRAEEIGRIKEYRENFDIAVARAVAKLPVLLEYNIPFLKKGGFFIAYKGPESSQEVILARKAADELGAKLEDEISVRLPFSGDFRTLVIFSKIRQTPDKYPRRPGTPEKKPLGT